MTVEARRVRASNVEQQEEKTTTAHEEQEEDAPFMEPSTVAKPGLLSTSRAGRRLQIAEAERFSAGSVKTEQRVLAEAARVVNVPADETLYDDLISVDGSLPPRARQVGKQVDVRWCTAQQTLRPPVEEFGSDDMTPDCEPVVESTFSSEPAPSPEVQFVQQGANAFAIHHHYYHV